jgi:hypothetical protein
MKHESITLAAFVQEEANMGLAPVATVARSLGYTEQQMALAREPLNRFAWHYAERAHVKPAAAQIDSCSGEDAA